MSEQLIQKSNNLIYLLLKNQSAEMQFILMVYCLINVRRTKANYSLGLFQKQVCNKLLLYGDECGTARSGYLQQPIP